MKAKSRDTSGLTTGNLLKLQARIHEIEPFLDKEGKFTADDFEVDLYQKQGVIDVLTATGALQASHYRKSGRRRREYRWNVEIKRILQEYLDNMDELPCGHRPHVYNDPAIPEDKLGCRYCAEQGEHPEYPKKLINSIDI